jgi:hypothetical protein
VDIVIKAPILIAESVKRYENKLVSKKGKSEREAIKTMMFAGCCILGASMMAAAGLQWIAYVPLFVIGGIIALKS